MSDRSPREISYFWKDALQRTIFCGINPVGYPSFKDGHFNDKILEGSDPLKSLEELRNSEELSDEEKAVVEGCIKVSKPLFDNPTYNIHNPFELEYVDLWNEVKKLNEMFGGGGFDESRCIDCPKRELEIEYIFDENGVLKRMVTGVVPVEDLRPRIWDPKFHRSFKEAKDKQSLPILNEYTLSDGKYVDEPIDENSSRSTENEIDKTLANDLSRLAEQDENSFGSTEYKIDKILANDLQRFAKRDEMNVRDGAKAENTADSDEVAAEQSDKFAPPTLIGTDEKTQ